MPLDYFQDLRKHKIEKEENMKKKYNIKNIFSFLFLILFCESSNAVPRCEQFYQDVFNDDLKMDVFQDEYD